MTDLEKVEKLINRLSEGKPVGSLDTFGLIRQIGGTARDVFRTRVEKDTERGAGNRSHTTWLVADYGGGKSEMLLQLKGSLDQITIGGQKVVVSSVDLNENLSNTYLGVQSSIFHSASPLRLQNPEVEVVLKKSSEQADDRETFVLFGLDFLAAFTGAAFLGASVWQKPINWIKQRLLLRPKSLAEAVKSYGLNDDDSIQLLVRWIRYAYYRDDATWRSFNDYLEHLAEQEHLFDTQCRILRKFGYVTVVILVDQAEKLVGQTRLTQALMNTRDSGRESGINIFYVFAGTAEIHQLWDKLAYEGFVRRFLDPQQCSVVKAELDEPNIEGGNNDDLVRVRGPLANIAALHPSHYAWLKKTDAEITSIRNRLRALGRPVTWSIFWHVILADASFDH